MARRRVFNLQLMITEDCNLRCAYCFEIDKGPRQMDVELAKNILDHELSQPSDYDEFQVDLAGGEPFLHFDYLREIVQYGRENAARWDKQFHFFVCSNLTLLNDNIKEWLEANTDCVVLGTSLDGTKDAHDRYRCGSYDAVVSHIPFFKKTYPQQGVKMTIGPETIGSIYEGIKNIESMGLTPSANVVYEPVWGESANKRKSLVKFAEQLDLLVQHYLENPELDIPTILALPTQLSVVPQNAEHRWCGSGLTMRAFDTDGRSLPCHRFSRFCTKRVYLGQDSIGPRVSSKCDDCKFVDACPTCPGFNWQVNGHPESRTSHHCEFIKLQLLATAKLNCLKNQSLVRRLASSNPPHAKELSEDDLNRLSSLQAAYLIMKSINADEILSMTQ